MRSTSIKYNFNGGELSPFLDGRIDFPKYLTGCKEMTNFLPTVYGPMTKRPGTRFVDDLGGEAQLFPFEFSETQAYIFAFLENSVKVYTGDGVLVHEGTPVEFPSPYTLEQAKTVKFAQTGDVVYFTHPVAGMFKVSRTSATTFNHEEFTPRNGPFQDENNFDDSTIKVETISGSNYKLTATKDIFTQADIGAWVKIGYIPATQYDTWLPNQGSWSVGDILQYQNRIYQISAVTGTAPVAAGSRTPLHDAGTKSDGVLDLRYISDGYGYARITKVNSSKVAEATVAGVWPPGVVGGPPQISWAWSSFGGRFGWPSAIVFHQQRMILGGSLEQPQTIWGSVTGDIENFDGSTTDADKSYNFTIAANKKNPIAWLVSNQTLNIGTLGGEFIGSSDGPSITPTDISINQVGQYGSSTLVAPLIANGFTVFCQTGGRKLRELRFDDESQRNFARDLNKVAEHIADKGFTEIAFQAEPYQVIWCVTGGVLYALTYETDEDVFAWSRQDCGEVVSITTIPNGANDRLWMVVKRDGKYFIEFLTQFYRRGHALEDACFVDSSLEYDGPEIQTLSGLDHLEGKVVNVLNEGSVGQPQLVENGTITLQYPTTRCVVGLPYKASWQSLRFEGGSNDGVGQGKVKRLSSIIFRLEKTGAGLFYGKGTIDKQFSELNTHIPVRTTNDAMDEAPSLLDGDTWRQGIDGGSDPQYMLRVEHTEPTPCTIITIICTVDTAQ